VGDRQTNELLGYPAEARLLLVNADDFGMCHSVTEAILQTLNHGIVTSATLMTPCPWAPHALQLLREYPALSCGVHLTLVRDFGNYRWGPLSPSSEIPSLVDETGSFYSYDRIPVLLAGARLDEVEVEFRAQIESVLAAELAPTHLDWHCLADGGRGDIFELTLRLAQEYRLAMRVHGYASAERCRRDGLATSDHGVLDSYHLDSTDKASRYAELLRELPAGLSEWAVHPSLGNAESQALEPENWQVRKADFDFFTSQEAYDLLAEEGIVLVGYKALQVQWSR
jgi:hypothetical protein